MTIRKTLDIFNSKKEGDSKMNRKYYTVNAEKKKITIDDSVKPTQQDKDDVQMYVTAGYIIRHKSEKRSSAVASRSSSITNEEIQASLKGDKKNYEQYLSIKSGKGKGTGFFAAKSFYLSLNKNQEQKEAQ